MFLILGTTALLAIDSSGKAMSPTLFRTRRLVAFEVRIWNLRLPSFILMTLLTAYAYSREYGGHLELRE